MTERPQVTTSERPARPVLRYHGGKFRLAGWITSLMPAHRTYTEAFGGAASVLLAKPRTYAEIYNDVDAEVVNVFRVLRDPERAARLEALIRLTPYARAEFEGAYEPSEDPVEQARRTIVKSFMGFASASIFGRAPRGFRSRVSTNSTGFRANSQRSGTTGAHDWANYPRAIAAFVERLVGVVVDCRDACEVIAQHDSVETLHYVDPPYVMATRRRGEYRHEFEDADHLRLVHLLRDVGGMVMLSGYRSDLYAKLLGGWARADRAARADGGRPRTESLWLNPAAQERAPQRDLWPASRGGGQRERRRREGAIS